jgi:hypothetical protein
VTAALGAEAATAADVGAVAPSASAPVGTARAGAGRAGTKPRTQRQLHPRKAAKKTTSTTSSATTGTSSTGGTRPQVGFWARKAASPSKGRLNRSGARQLLVAEFVVCVLILGLSPLTDKHKTDTPPAWLKRGTSICGVFIVLGLVATGGPKAARLAASFGGLVTLALALSDRDVFVAIARRLGAASGTGPAGPEAPPAKPPAGELPVPPGAAG